MIKSQFKKEQLNFENVYLLLERSWLTEVCDACCKKTHNTVQSTNN